MMTTKRTPGGWKRTAKAATALVPACAGHRQSIRPAVEAPLTGRSSFSVNPRLDHGPPGT
jgi:hypothetical protein